MIALACKSGVTPPILWIAAALTRLTLPVPRLTITAGSNGAHKINSLHYALRALDLRTKDFPSLAAKHALVEGLQRELGPDYDVLLEGLGTANEHCHVEYDEKPTSGV